MASCLEGFFHVELTARSGRYIACLVPLGRFLAALFLGVLVVVGVAFCCTYWIASCMVIEPHMLALMRCSISHLSLLALSFPAGSSTCAFDVQTSSFQRAKAEYPEVLASQCTGERGVHQIQSALPALAQSLPFCAYFSVCLGPIEVQIVTSRVGPWLSC